MTLIEAYERTHFPMDLPDAVDAIKFRMEQSGLTVEDLEPVIGRKNRVYEVLSRKRPLSLRMIAGLHARFGIPAESLLKQGVAKVRLAGKAHVGVESAEGFFSRIRVNARKLRKLDHGESLSPGVTLYRAWSLIGVLALVFSLPLRAAETLATSSAVAEELRQSTQTLLDAIAPGDVAVWDRLLDDNAIQIDENDVVRNKSEQLKALKPLGPGLEGHLLIDDFRMVEHGETAVVTHEDDEYLKYHGQVLRSRFRMTDTWIHSPSGWRLLASQVLAVLQDPPARALAPKVLCGYSGTYELTDQIKGTIRCAKDELLFEQPQRPTRHFRPELLDVFFEPGAPRTRRIFLRDTRGHITGFVDRREARDVLWRRQKAIG